MSDEGDLMKLRVALSRVATAVGAHVDPTCSIEFLCEVPREVELVMQKTSTERELRAFRREKSACDEIERLREEIKALSQALHEECA